MKIGAAKSYLLAQHSSPSICTGTLFMRTLIAELQSPGCSDYNCDPILVL
jgi:hypothetical protein